MGSAHFKERKKIPAYSCRDLRKFKVENRLLGYSENNAPALI